MSMSVILSGTCNWSKYVPLPLNMCSESLGVQLQWLDAKLLKNLK